MNELKDDSFDVIAIGKISDIYDGEGITESLRTKSNMDGMDKLVQTLDKGFTGISFVNLVDFDALFGHRRDPEGYGKALEEFDARLPEVFERCAKMICSSLPPTTAMIRFTMALIIQGSTFRFLYTAKNTKSLGASARRYIRGHRRNDRRQL